MIQGSDESEMYLRNLVHRRSTRFPTYGGGIHLGIFFKSWRIATRSRRRFFGFVVAYSMLALSIATSFKQLEDDPGNYVLLIVTLCVGIILSTMYGLILTTFRKKEIATLKAIGWSNGDVRTRILGEILFLSLIGYLLLLELDIHLLGVSFYIFGLDVPRLASTPLVQNLHYSQEIFLFTFIIIILLQVPGVLFANNRALQVKPMVALQAI